jgi:hypothetical protein
VDKILNVENCAQVNTHFRTIVMSDSAGLINEHSYYRVAVRTADFGMNQFQTVVDRNLFGDIAHPLCNRP